MVILLLSTKLFILLCSYYFRFVGGGQSGFGPFLNSGVHMVMYLYYFLAACGPSLQKYLWWKRWGTAASDDNDDISNDNDISDTWQLCRWFSLSLSSCMLSRWIFEINNQNKQQYSIQWPLWPHVIYFIKWLWKSGLME